MKCLSWFGLPILVLILGLIVLPGCSEEKGIESMMEPEVEEVFTGDTTGVYSDNPEIMPGVMTADEINELGRQEHERRMANGTSPKSPVASWQLYVHVPFYSQRDENWYEVQLGFGRCGANDDIGHYGCHLCCIAMHYAKWGYSQMNPPGLNNWSYGGRAHYAFSSSGCGDQIRLPQALEYPGMCRPYHYISASQIYGELAAGHPVVVRTTVGGSHFMVIFAFDGRRFWVKDPWRDWTQQNKPLYGNAHPNHPFRVYGH